VSYASKLRVGRRARVTEERKQSPTAYGRPLFSSDSSAWRSRFRPRCSRNRWSASLIASIWHTSIKFIPCTSRSSTTSRCRSGGRARASRSSAGCLTAPSRFSAPSTQDSGGIAHPPDGPKREASTASSASATGMVRASWTPAVRAWLTRMVNSQVRSDGRPSELAKAAQHCQPGILYYFFGHRAA
jgi:hypothetical protein